MACVCYRPKGSCDNCPHYHEIETRWESEECSLMSDLDSLIGNQIKIIECEDAPELVGKVFTVVDHDSIGQILTREGPVILDYKDKYEIIWKED